MGEIDLDQDRRAGQDRRGERRSALGEDLDLAFARGEIEVLFQPQFAAADSRPIGAEALARWQHPRFGRIGGDELVAIAERSGRAAQLSHRIAQAALLEAAGWPAPLRLSLNVTAADLAAPDFAAAMAATAATSGFSPDRLTLEITEQSLVAELEPSAAKLRQLAELGIRVALDDFGAGFCNFDYLKRLPLHYLKLDRRMVEGIDESARDLAVLRGILALARALGLEVIAEGVEREAQREVIAREGCASWQGFLGAAPMTGTEFLALAAA